MKKFTKLFALIACSLIVSLATNAQTYVGIGLKTGIPTGDFADYAGFGLGGGIEVDYMVSDNVSVGFNGGYMAFFDNEIAPNVTGSSVVVPLLANLRYYFGDSPVTPLIGFGLGYTLVSQTTEVSIAGNTDDFSDNYNGFTINPHLGLRYAPSDRLSLSLTADYNYIFNSVEVDVVEQGDPVTGGANVVALDPYAYLGINLGLAFNITQ